MASLTEYFGLQRLSVGESFGTNGGKFIDEDRVILDRLLYMALSGHHHTGAAGGGDAPDAPTLILDDEGGSLPAGTRVYYRITLVDTVGNETTASPEVYVDTPNPITEPAGPAPRYETTGGTILAGAYFYLLSAYTDVNTQETRALNAGTLVVPTGSTNKIILDLPDLPAGASGFNVYKRGPGASSYHYLATIDMQVATPPTEYEDDGSVAEDCNRGVPVSNTTNSANEVTVVFPGTTPVVPEGYTWKIYRTMVAGNYTNSLLAWVVETETEGGGDIVTSFIDIGQATSAGRPPDVNQVVSSPDKVQLTDGAEVQGRLPVSRMSAFPYSVTFAYPGDLEDTTLGGTEGTFVWVCPFPQATIMNARAALGVGSVPSVDDIIVDVNVGGGATPVMQTIYPDQTQRPRVLLGQQVGQPKAPDVSMAEMVEGDVMSVDIDQALIGATATESDLSVTVLLFVYGWTAPESHVWA
jgi:hypothetical protein